MKVLRKPLRLYLKHRSVQASILACYVTLKGLSSNTLVEYGCLQTTKLFEEVKIDSKQKNSIDSFLFTTFSFVLCYRNTMHFPCIREMNEINCLYYIFLKCLYHCLRFRMDVQFLINALYMKTNGVDT